jgi:FSR family fosmidomycin resistance protein-like MFS transporter
MDAAAQEPGGVGPAEEGRTDFKVIGLIGVAHFFSHYYIYLLLPLFIELKAEFDVSYTELGLLLTVFSATTGLTQTPFGFIVDRLGARKILIAGLAVEGVAFLSMGFASGYTTLMALMMIAGCANGVYHPADYSILSASVSNRRMGQAFSLHTFAGNAGFALAPITIVFLSALVGWRNGLAICGAAGIATAALLVFYSRHFRDAPKPSSSSGTDAAQGGRGNGVSLLFTPPILMCLLFFTLLSLGSSGLTSFLIVALGQLHGMEEKVATFALTAYLVASSVGVLLGGFIADRTTRHNLVAAVCFFSTAILIAAIGAFLLPGALVVVLMVAQGLMHGAIMPSRDMIVRSVTPEGAFGKVFGFVTTGFSIGGSIAPTAFGWILDQSHPEWVFYGVALIMLCSMATVFTSGRRPAS